MGRFTKTPYLVLFILLGAVGVGTAAAVGTITLAGDVAITDNLTVDSTTLVVDAATDRVGINEATPVVGLHNRGKSIYLDETFEGSKDFPALWFKTATVSSDFHNMFMKGNEDLGDESVSIYHQNTFTPTDLPVEVGRAQTFWWTGAMSIGSFSDIQPTSGGMLIPGRVGIGTSTPDTNAELEVVGEILATPIVGQWSNDDITADIGTEFVEFDREKFPSDVTYFGFTAGDDFIQIKKAGLYRITAKVLLTNGVAGDIGVADVWRYNSADIQLERICRIFTTMAGTFADTECSSIHSFDANDRVKLEDDSSGTSIFGGGSGFNTFLNIERLN